MEVELEARADVDREAVEVAREPVVGVRVDEESPDVADPRLEAQAAASEEQLPCAVLTREELHAEGELEGEHVDDAEARSQRAGDARLEAEVVPLKVGELPADQCFAAQLQTLELGRRGGGQSERGDADDESQSPCHTGPPKQAASQPRAARESVPDRGRVPHRCGVATYRRALRESLRNTCAVRRTPTSLGPSIGDDGYGAPLAYGRRVVRR